MTPRFRVVRLVVFSVRRGPHLRLRRFPVGACCSGRSGPGLELGPDGVDLALEVGEVAGVVDHPRRHLARAPRRSPGAPSAARRRRAARRAARAGRAATSSGASTTITAAVLDPPLRLDEQRHVVHDDAVGRRGRDLPEELLADRRMRDRLELLCDLVVDERPLGRARRGRASRRGGGSRDRTARPAWPARACPARPLHARSRRRRPRPRPAATSSAATVDFPDPMPPVRPTMSTREVYESGRRATVDAPVASAGPSARSGYAAACR